LNADVFESKLESAQNNTSIFVGHLKASLIGDEGKEGSQGSLLMKGRKYLGNFRVLLDPQPWEKS
jgi:hypothetical protein